MMKAGLYYIGDLCYVLDNKDWDEVCELTINGHQCLGGEFEFKDGRRFAIYNTKFGDGVYHDQFGNKYCVDSGSIGCIKVGDTTKGDIAEMRRLGAVVEMQYSFNTWENLGLIGICSNHIDTAGEWVEDEYDYDEEDEYDHEEEAA